MTLEDLRSNYDYFSGKASEIARQLGFAGIALIWIFKTDVNGHWVVPTELLPAAFLLVIGLALDFLHYIAGTLVWGIYNGMKERAGTSNEDQFMAPRPINWPALTFFWGKIVTIISSYGLIAAFLAGRVVA